MGSTVGTEAPLSLLKTLKLLFVETLQEAHPPLFHLDKSTLEPLPQLIVLCPPDVRAMPDGMLDELLELVDPLGLEHVLLDRLDSDHEPRHILNENIVACDQ